MLDSCVSSKIDAKDLFIIEEMRALLENNVDLERLKQRSVSLISLTEENINKYKDVSYSAIIFFVPVEEKYLKLIVSFVNHLMKHKIKKMNMTLVTYPQRTIVSQL